MSLARLSSYYGHAVVGAVVQIFLLPINLSILGLELWSLFGLVALLKTIISRLDAGAQVLVQVEAAKNESEERRDQLYSEIIVLSFLVSCLAYFGAMFLMRQGASSNETYELALSTNTAALIILCALFAAMTRMVEANLIGHSRELLVNLCRTISLVVIALSPYVIVEKGGGSISQLFQVIFTAELLHFTTILIASLFYKKNYLSLVSLGVFRFHEVREKIKALSSAATYQLTAFLSVGLDVVVLSYIMPQASYSIIILILTIKNILNSIMRPLVSYGTQEIYKKDKVDQNQFLHISFVVVALWNLLVFIGVYTVLEYWVDNEALLSQRAELYTIVMSSTWFFLLSAIVATSNLSESFFSRTISYFASGIFFYFFLLVMYFVHSALTITLIAVAFFVREFIVVVIMLVRASLLKGFIGRGLCLMLLQLLPLVAIMYTPVAGIILASLSVIAIAIFFRRDIIAAVGKAQRHLSLIK